MREKKKALKLNNQGLTLVELLVAMTIIAIISVSFYNGFVVAAKTNNKAKIQHKATSLAQNVLEGLKAENMDNIMHQFTWPKVTVTAEDGVTTSEQTNFRILNSQIMEGSYTSDKIGTFATATAPYASSEDGGVTAKYVLNDSGQYYLYLRNLKMENTAFDALITIDGSKYMADSVTGLSASGQTFNTDEVVKIPTINVNYDAVVSNGLAYDADKLLTLEDEVGSTLNESQIKRCITINIENKQMIGGNWQQKVTASYEYSYGGHTVTETDVVFNNRDETEKQLRNIYVYVDPKFNWAEDKIVINNNKLGSAGPYETQVYIIKQQTTTDMVTLNNELSNTTYKMQIHVNDDDTTATQSKTSIRTNLGYSLKEGKPIALNPLQATYYHDGSVMMDTNAETYYDLNTLTNSQRVDMLFDVKVEIFLHGEDDMPTGTTVAEYLNDIVGEKKATMEGSIRN